MDEERPILTTDRRLSSDPFHSWGALFGIMAFMEAGHLAPFEAPIVEVAQ